MLRSILAAALMLVGAAASADVAKLPLSATTGTLPGPQLPALAGGDCTTAIGGIVVSCGPLRAMANTWTGPQTFAGGLATPFGAVAAYAGTPTSGQCAQWSTGGVLIGAPCGSGSGSAGSGTISAGAPNQLPIYTGATTLSPLTVPTAGLLIAAGGAPSFSSVLPPALGGLGASSLSGLLKGNGASPATPASPHVDYLVPGDALSAAGGALAGSLTIADPTPSYDNLHVLGRYTADSVNGCALSAGEYYANPDGSLSENWIPTCSGTWAGSNSQQVPVYNITGVACLGEGSANGCATPQVPEPRAMMTSQVLIQSVTADTTNFQNALTINMVANNGEYYQEDDGTFIGNNQVGITDFIAQMPHPDGRPAPPVWLQNPELVVYPNSQGTLALGAEWDYSNLDKDCTLDNFGGA